MEMNIRLMVLLTGISLCFIRNVLCTSAANVRQLTKDLLTNYDKRVRPVGDQSQTLKLDLSFNLCGVNSVDEVAEKLVTTGFIYAVWTDEGLTWSSATNNNINYIFLMQNDIWKPDLVLKNGFTKFKEMGGDFYYVHVGNDGLVQWRPYEVFETRCSIDITRFPYDKQTCNIIFIVWSYVSVEVSITKSSGGLVFYEYEENSVWTVESTSNVISNYGTESQITFILNLKRKPQYYVMNMIIPVICLGILSLLVFIIPADAGEKMGYSVTVLLSFAVFLTMISAELPVNSESTSFLSFYLILQMVIGAFILVITAVQLRLHHRKSSVGIAKFFIYIVKFEQFLRCKKSCRSSNTTDVKPMDCSDDNKDEVVSDDSDIDWNDVTSAIDFLCFWIFLLGNTALTIFLFAYITSG
ncbi:acetylcholine receptor subunit beta-like [Saccostrea echinata]|uniref:acetylcholine receptor subunit beta-like n=1 Tax=Saccostrea echinata TaxID=191078 RepID=UPI002A822734|nr:acetylcholine receptor subunit beta-like [Saccostrea echinata]